MEKKSIYNMITSILASLSATTLMILSIVFMATKHNILGVILSSIFYPLIIIYFILKSICFGISNQQGKNILSKINKIISDIFICLIASYFILQIGIYFKWILFGLTILISLINIFLDIFGYFPKIRYTIHGIIAFTLICTISYVYSINLLTIICLPAIILFYLGNLLGNILNNKFLLSLDLLSITLFGLFLIFI